MDVLYQNNSLTSILFFYIIINKKLFRTTENKKTDASCSHVSSRGSVTRNEVIMEAYTSFARVYDMFMDNVPYEVWSRYIVEKLRANGIDSGYVVDLGCGTGKLTTLLADAGYDMIGIDNSFDMLDMALEREDDRILYLMQDMREFEPGEKVSAVVSACDSINYILEPEDLQAVFFCVSESLKEGGIFIFDINTPYKYEVLMADNTIAENRDEGSFIWDNYYDADEKINEYDLTLFIKEQSEDEDDIYKKFEETHFQRCYEISELKELLEQSGLVFDAVYDAYTDDQVKCDSEKVTVIAHKA